MSHFSLPGVFGIDEERAKEMSAELHDIVCDPNNNMQDVSQILSKTYDPESLLMGAFLGLSILMNNNRVVPQGYQVSVDATPTVSPDPYIDPGVVG